MKSTPVAWSALEARDDGALGSGVDRGRLVAALARADDRLPFEPRRQLLEARSTAGGRLAAEGEPVGHSSNGEKRRPLVELWEEVRALLAACARPRARRPSTWSTRRRADEEGGGGAAGRDRFLAVAALGV